MLMDRCSCRDSCFVLNCLSCAGPAPPAHMHPYTHKDVSRSSVSSLSLQMSLHITPARFIKVRDNPRACDTPLTDWRAKIQQAGHTWCPC